MLKVDVTQIQMVEEELSGQSADLQNIIEQLHTVISEIKGMADTDQIVLDIRHLVDELEAEVITHKALAETLSVTAEIYQRTEEDIVNVMEQEKQIYSPVLIEAYDATITDHPNLINFIRLY